MSVPTDGYGNMGACRWRKANFGSLAIGSLEWREEGCRMLRIFNDVCLCAFVVPYVV
jgi:hypothetical protein